MKKSTIKFLSIFLAISVLICTLNVSVFASDEIDDSIEKVYCEATIDDDFTDNEILIVVTPENNFREYTINDFSNIGCIEIEDLTIEPKENELCRIFHLTLSFHSKQNVLDSIKVLEEREDIYSAEPNYKNTFSSSVNDSVYTNGDQWAIDKIQLRDAWDIETGSDSVKVGVIDTGIAASHPDLVNRVNTELSRSFVSRHSSATNGIVDSHGTHVAGIIGAEANNGIGISGVCWNVDLISLRVDDIDTDGTLFVNDDAVIEAIKYAQEIGVDILNYSSSTFCMADCLTALETQIQNFEGLFVCAAGNHDYNNDILNNEGKTWYPSSYNLSNLISVGASNIADRKWENSNYGPTTVDIFAPGDDIYSTIVDENGNFGYDDMSGTSMAAPIVSGVAALLLSAHPELSAAELKAIIMSSVNYYYNDYGYSIFDRYCISDGVINASKALTNNVLHNYSDDSDDYEVTTNGHICVCLTCGYEKQEPHTFKYSSNNLRNHTVSCKYCSFTNIESHNFNLLTGICKICGYNSNNMGTLSRKNWLTELYVYN